MFVSPYQADEARWTRSDAHAREALVGMPGDTLYMRDGMLYVNGVAQRQGFAADATTAATSQPSDASDLRLAAQSS